MIDEHQSQGGGGGAGGEPSQLACWATFDVFFRKFLCFLKIIMAWIIENFYWYYSTASDLWYVAVISADSEAIYN